MIINRAKKTAYSASIAFLLLVMGAGALVYLAPHLGWRIDAIYSGSMSPAIERGALVVAYPIEPEQIMLNDIIIFRPVAIGENEVCHRVVDVRKSSPLSFQTRGDANPGPDPFPVPSGNVTAKVVYTMPFIGFAVMFLKSPTGLFAALVLPGVVIMLLCMRSLMFELKLVRKGAANNEGA